MNAEQKFKFSFQDQDVEFNLTEKNLMVNATEMAKIFGKQVNEFLSNQQTQNFIEHCLKNGDSRFLGVKTEEDLVVSKQKSGTWMHRILALKFAAWLNPDFELWVYATIDDILFGYYREIEEDMKMSAVRKTKMEDLEKVLLDNPDFQMLESLKFEERQAISRRIKRNRNQMDIFKNMYSDGN